MAETDEETLKCWNPELVLGTGTVVKGYLATILTR